MEYRKPNKTAFVKMQKLLDVPFEEMCYIGDNVMKDFLAPDALGIKTFLINNLNGIYTIR